MNTWGLWVSGKRGEGGVERSTGTRGHLRIDRCTAAPSRKGPSLLVPETSWPWPPAGSAGLPPPLPSSFLPSPHPTQCHNKKAESDICSE